MPYRVLIKRSAEKELDALPASVRERIAARLLTLEENPRPTGVRKLQGEQSYRLYKQKQAAKSEAARQTARPALDFVLAVATKPYGDKETCHLAKSVLSQLKTCIASNC